MKRNIKASEYIDALDKLDKEHQSIIDDKIKRIADEAFIDVENLLDHIYEASNSVSQYHSYVLQELDSIRQWTDTLEEMVTEAVDEYNESIASI